MLYSSDRVSGAAVKGLVLSSQAEKYQSISLSNIFSMSQSFEFRGGGGKSQPVKESFITRGLFYIYIYDIIYMNFYIYIYNLLYILTG